MPFQKDTFTPGSLPAFDAAAANRVTKGIDDLFKRRLVYDGVWTNAAPLNVLNLDGDTEGPYRIQVAGRLNGSADYQMSLILNGALTQGGQLWNSRNTWIESYMNADNTMQPPQNGETLRDNHLFLGAVRWGEACEITTDMLLWCNSGRPPVTSFVSSIKPVVTMDARHMHYFGNGFLYYPRSVTGFSIAPAVGTAGTSFSGRIVIDKLGLS